MTEAEMTEALREVRQAYRIVVLFQKRISDIFRRVDNLAEKEGLSFEWWWPNRYNPPMRTNQKQFAAGKWTWDFFPGHCLSASWVDDSGVSIRRLWLGLDTDTAFIEARKKGGEPDPAQFEAVTSPTSRTELWFSLYTSNPGAADWDEVWSRKLKPNDLWKTAQSQYIQWSLGSQSGTYRCWKLPVEKLVSSEALDTLLIDPITAALRSHRS